MRWWDRQYKDPAYLCTLTLGELGTLLEWTVHNDMHMRWASAPRDPRTNAFIPDGRPNWDISKDWDNPEYDHLGEQYSSHVNPVFWRLHGWVDARIEDWFLAHELAHPGEVTRLEVMGVPWFIGKKWVQIDMPLAGPMHHTHAMTGSSQVLKNGEDMDVETMEQIIELILPPPSEIQLTAESITIPQRFRPVHPRLRSHF